MKEESSKTGVIKGKLVMTIKSKQIPGRGK